MSNSLLMYSPPLSSRSSLTFFPSWRSAFVTNSLNALKASLLFLSKRTSLNREKSSTNMIQYRKPPGVWVWSGPCRSLWILPRSSVERFEEILGKGSRCCFPARQGSHTSTILVPRFTAMPVARLSFSRVWSRSRPMWPRRQWRRSFETW